jgi:DNA polymerase kappa
MVIITNVNTTASPGDHATARYSLAMTDPAAMPPVTESDNQDQTPLYGQAQDSLAKTGATTEPPVAETDDQGQVSAHISAAPKHNTLKYSLLGPSLTKAGVSQDKVDQGKVSEIIYSASKGSKFFNREEVKDQILTRKIAQILEKKRRLERLDLTRDLRHADQQIAELEATRDLTQYIVHVDCDAFYAAVELLDRPELRNVPFAVGGGVLTTCNYVARRFGCRSGMAGFVAKRLCPELLLLPPNFDKYMAKAQEVREVLAEYDPRFESASCDEAYLNITSYCAEHDMAPTDVVQQMRDAIHEHTKITVSAGIAANAKLAKICSNMNKPNGQYLLANDRQVIVNFMRDLPCRKVNGIGRVLERELLEIGVKTCGDIYPQRQYLRQLFGDKTFDFLMTIHLGIGRTSIQPAEDYERKSVGTESTFREMSDPVQLREKMRHTAEELEKDMRRAECKGRTLCIKVKLHTFEVYTRQTVTPVAIHKADDLYNYALPMLAKLEQEFPGMKLRLLGLRCTHLVSTKKPDTRAFFGFRPKKPEQSTAADNAPKPKTDGQGDGEWEEWPEATADGADAELEELLGSQRDEEAGQNEDDDDGFRHHGKEVVPNPKRKKDAEAEEAEEEQWWDCPICSRPQAADERLFNSHIDWCLSQSAIRDAVQAEAPGGGLAPSRSGGEAVAEGGSNKRLKTGDKKKRGRTASAAADPRQTKLCFG